MAAPTLLLHIITVPPALRLMIAMTALPVPFAITATALLLSLLTSHSFLNHSLIRSLLPFLDLKQRIRHDLSHSITLRSDRRAHGSSRIRTNHISTLLKFLGVGVLSQEDSINATLAQ